MKLAEDVEFLELKIREAYEAWAGSELSSKPEALTAPEAYAYRVLEEVMIPIREAIEEQLATKK